MANPDNNGSAGGAPPGRHRDAAKPLPSTPNPQPAQPGGILPVSGSQVFERVKREGVIEPNWAVDQPGGAYPREAGATPPPLAQYTDPSPPRGPDPLPTQSPPAPMDRHPHLVDRRKKG